MDIYRTFRQQAVSCISDYLKKMNITDKTFRVDEQSLESPPDKSFGDLSFPCFPLARVLKKSPDTISRELSEHINNNCRHDLFERIENTGPYLNFFIDKKRISEFILKVIYNNKVVFPKKKERVMVEYSQPNTHKELHIGHLRNISLGNSLVNIMRKAGYAVISANYIGDIGSHVAKTIWCYTKFHKNDKIKEIKKDACSYFGRVYSEAVRLTEENEEYRREASIVQQKLESGDKRLIGIWRKTRKMCLDEFNSIYKELNVKFDIFFYESEVEQEGIKLVKELLKKGIAKESDGAIIMDLKKYNLDVFLLLKSDGTSLYATKDIPLAKRKFEKYRIDKSIYVVDSRQSLYFRQLFKTLELMGFRKEMIHLPYEFVMLKEGAMSSRKGNIISYKSLLSEMMMKTISETKSRHPEWPKKKIEDTARAISIGGILFDMLKQDNNKVIVFDIKEATDIEGESAAYCQYTYVRTNSILKKAAKEKIFYNDKIDYDLDEAETEIAKQLAMFSEVVEKSSRDYKPQLLARYLIELCKLFNRFYHEKQVLKANEPERKKRLLLVYSVNFILKECMKMLGIPLLSEM